MTTKVCDSNLVSCNNIKLYLCHVPKIYITNRISSLYAKVVSSTLTMFETRYFMTYYSTVLVINYY